MGQIPGLTTEDQQTPARTSGYPRHTQIYADPEPSSASLSPPASKFRAKMTVARDLIWDSSLISHGPNDCTRIKGFVSAFPDSRYSRYPSSTEQNATYTSLAFWETSSRLYLLVTEAKTMGQYMTYRLFKKPPVSGEFRSLATASQDSCIHILASVPRLSSRFAFLTSMRSFRQFPVAFLSPPSVRAVNPPLPKEARNEVRAKVHCAAGDPARLAMASRKRTKAVFTTASSSTSCLGCTSGSCSFFCSWCNISMSA